MALDEAKDTDEVYEIGGYKYIVDKEFLAQATPINVEFTEMGFKVTSSIDLGGGCGSCSSAGSCG